MSNHSLKLKMFVAILMVVVATSAASTYIYYASSARDIGRLETRNISESQRALADLLDADTRVLSSTLLALLDNDELAHAFLARDKDKLFARAAPLFADLKRRFRITHWYFIEAEGGSGRCFLRVHDKRKSGDIIERFTFRRAADKKQLASGVELGKTAFALRAVSPYYHDGKLIGYMELGEEIDHLFAHLKANLNADLALLVGKRFLNRDDWRSAQTSKGLEDSWDEMPSSLLVTSTTGDARLVQFTGSLESLSKEGAVLEQAQRNGRRFLRGIFPFEDASNRRVGGVFVLHDITRQADEIQTNIRAFLGSSAAILVFGFLIAWLLTATIARPVLDLAGRLASLSRDLAKLAHVEEVTSDEQVSVLSKARETIDVMLTMMREIAKRSSSVLGNAERTVVGNREVAQRIDELNRHAEKVAEILATITQIADRSDLLALNAALEGDRAREAGAGFMLVAAEMRRLAESVMESVEGIRDLMSRIHGASQAAVLAGQEGIALSEETTRSAGSIADAAQRQGKATAEVGQSMDSMTKMVRLIMMSTSRTAATASDLVEVALRLERVVHGRRIGKQARKSAPASGPKTQPSASE